MKTPFYILMKIKQENLILPLSYYMHEISERRICLDQSMKAGEVIWQNLLGKAMIINSPIWTIL